MQPTHIFSMRAYIISSFRIISTFQQPFLNCFTVSGNMIRVTAFKAGNEEQKILAISSEYICTKDTLTTMKCLVIIQLRRDVKSIHHLFRKRWHREQKQYFAKCVLRLSFGQLTNAYFYLNAHCSATLAQCTKS